MPIFHVLSDVNGISSAFQAFSDGEAHASASRVRPDSWRAGREVWDLACGSLASQVVR